MMFRKILNHATVTVTVCGTAKPDNLLREVMGEPGQKHSTNKILGGKRAALTYTTLRLPTARL
jgi:hypothetical protein